MGKRKYLSLLPLVALILSSCNIGSSNPNVLGTPVIAGTGTVTVFIVDLKVQATNATGPFNTPGQNINYQYTITNTGIVPLPGPASIIDNKATVTCPAITATGNANATLEQGESLICTGTYAITQTDLTSGLVVNTSTANVGGFSSLQATTTVSFAPQAGALKLTKTASPLTYNQVGQVIMYTYVIQNTGTVAIGPVQFTVTDNKIATPINCGPPASTLAPQQTITCTAAYSIVQADLTAGSVINSATASGGGTNVSGPATTTITVATPPSGLTRGSTISHKVVKDEWMIQIARCYGASFDAIRLANPQVRDPDEIEIDETLTVPNIGSNGTIYGPPCVEHHTVQSGDTWASIAQRYNADVAVLQAANPGGMAVGTVLKIPRNSLGSVSSIPVTGVTVTGTPPTSTPTMTLTPSLTPSPVTPTPTVTGTPATPTPSPTGAVAIQATPIVFPVGTTSTILTGSLAPQGAVRYILGGTQGQILALKVTAPVNEVAATITAPNGAILPPLNTTLTWSAVLPMTGDYRIDLSGIAGTLAKPYSIEISLTLPSATP